MVLITFDDAVNWDNWDFYLRLFPPDGSRRNPNGCPAAATLFVSNNFTDYCMVRKLHGRGLEIADHSLTHRLPHAWWAEASREDIENEIVTQRHNLAELADIPVTDIRGWRSPFLQPSGDNMFEVSPTWVRSFWKVVSRVCVTSLQAELAHARYFSPISPNLTLLGRFLRLIQCNLR